ncbi:MAG TPA: valine--tRNA ligase, partial [Candidatus Saccharimonadales bacterium]|nr:valine--tRNA ligase [Candidatus Saccharimonadales bacterium]
MDKAYDAKEVEEKLYNNWEQKGYFKPEINPTGKPFSIVLPPPNVTGTLHIGHAFEGTLQDIVIRYQRMKGNKTVWVPGTDHAPIATQSKFETDLFKKIKKSRHDYSRSEFVDMIQKFALENQAIIINQLRKLGLSLDWDRLAFTFDEKREKSVRTAFKQMYDTGLIYQGSRIVNWDPKMQTTVSDDEIEYVSKEDPFYYFKYGPFVIGTVRPETKFGDKYVVMHPKDKRYKDYAHGQKIDLEWINGPISATVIKDEAADMEKGSGVMTITPAHSAIDFEIAQRHGLDTEQVIDDRGILLPIAGEFAGEHIKKARPMIVEKLKEKGLLDKIDENYEHNVATNYRGGGIIEPQIKKQWFIAVNKEFIIKNSKIPGIKSGSKITLKKIMQKAVNSGAIKIEPKRFEKIYFHWIDNLRDWCISRQIIYGHQIPVWYKDSETYVGIDAPTGAGWKQESDTLDTWFSSGLWSFSPFGWPDKTPELADFYPNSIMMPGYEILFFWVARMILMSGFLLGEIPFKRVYLHGIVRDREGRKFSKSLNNGVNPLEMIEKYGTDALRMALVFGAASGNDVMFDEQKVQGMKHFANKLWNIGRFVEMNSPDFSSSERSESRSNVIPAKAGIHGSRIKSGMTNSVTDFEELKKIAKHEIDKKWVKKVEDLTKETTKYLDDYKFNLAAERLYEFIWHEFADIYIEDVKNREDKNSYLILNTLYLILLRLL